VAISWDRPSIEWSRDVAELRVGQRFSVIDDHADAAWSQELDDLFLRIGHRFGRADLRRRMRDYVWGLLAPVGRKNGWQPAEFAGHRTPDVLQRLLNGASWDTDDVRDDLQTPELPGESRTAGSAVRRAVARCEWLRGEEVGMTPRT
jgi:hypothetical protein